MFKRNFKNNIQNELMQYGNEIINIKNFIKTIIKLDNKL